MYRRQALIALLGLFCLVTGSDVEVTCGSATKLRHVQSKYHLHSHGINWGSGSGQQSVTAHGSEDDQGGLWLVKEAEGALPCEAGEPIKCGSFVRLEHVLTGKNLHSHFFTSPLSRQQEVSCFGESGEGDTGDTWVVECTRSSDEAWVRGGQVRLKHKDTKRYLQASTGSKFNSGNCPNNCPILGQLEVSGIQTAGSTTTWTADQGMYLASTS
ncbi:unnamed protein product [Choristocarpus tenellus]